MPKNPFALDVGSLSVWGSSSEKRGPEKKKRKTLTPAQRIYIWERPKVYGRTCSICHSKITKLSDLELDHTRAHSKGGKRLALAHRDCNRVKSSGSLGQIQKKLGIKSKRRHKSKRKISRSTNPFGIQPLRVPKLEF